MKVLTASAIQPFGTGRLAEKRQRHGSYTGVSQASYRTNSLLIDADSEDEDVVNGGAVAHGSGHAYLGNHRVSKSPSNHFQTPSWTSSYQVKEVKERFKYTDTEGNDLWAYVKTVYNNDGRQVFILNEDGSGTEVSLNPLPGQCIYKREDYLDITKYWRDHHVPDYSIERSKPVVLRDAYVPEYSRLSARAQAWRGFTKPRASLASRVTFPISTHNQPLSSYKNQTGSSRKHHAGNGNGRSFHKYRNRRRRRQNYNKRTKINLATLVPHPVEQTEKHFRGKDAKKPDDHLHLENLHAVIVENLPDSLTNAYVKVSTRLR